MLKESNISPNETRSRSGPPRRLAATQDPDRKAVLKPAAQLSLAVIPSQTAGMATKAGSASSARRRSGADCFIEFLRIDVCKTIADHSERGRLARIHERPEVRDANEDYCAAPAKRA